MSSPYFEAHALELIRAARLVLEHARHDQAEHGALLAELAGVAGIENVQLRAEGIGRTIDQAEREISRAESRAARENASDDRARARMWAQQGEAR